jgi:16S rRNA G966 N2-methylase RsmD
MNCSSPYDYYLNNYDLISEKARELMNKDQNHSFRFYLREALYELIPECTTFSIEASKLFFKFMNSKIVLDPSSGWGDRILGAAASGVVKTYHGVDPNPSLRKSYDEIIRFIKLNGVEGDYQIITDDFLEVEIDEETYDTVFTSPPYFSYEIYTEDQKQSISGRVTVQDWLNGFFFPYLEKAWRGLKLKGIFAIYIADTRAGKYVEKMYDHVTNVLHGNFRGIIAVTNPSLDHGYPIWIWRRDRI